MSDDIKTRIEEARARVREAAAAQRTPPPPRREPIPDGAGGLLYQPRPGRTYAPRPSAEKAQNDR